jgi:hypothetical protein
MKSHFLLFCLWVSLVTGMCISSMGCFNNYILGPLSQSTPTSTPTPTPISVCNSYSDNFSLNTLGNYDYFLNSSQTVSTAAGCDYTISGGYLLVDPTSNPGTNNGGLAIVKNTLYGYNYNHYTVTATFEMDNYTQGEGSFGLAFRTGTNGSDYSFVWDGNVGNGNGGIPDWEFLRNTGAPLVNYYFLGCCVTTPNYVLGSTVTMKVVVTGNNYVCYANTGSGFVQIFNITDSTYTSGGMGILTYGIHQGNKVQVSNFSVDTCP